jgi:YbbR domain-containing protein
MLDVPARAQAFTLLDQKTLKISLDLTKIREGPNEMLLTREMVRNPASLFVAGIEPDRIWLMASKLLPISFPIEVRTEGNLVLGFALQGIEETPSSATVLAPRRSRQEGIKVPTAPIDLRKLTATTTVNPKPLFPTEVRFIEGKSPTVKVTIKIQAARGIFLAMLMTKRRLDSRNSSLLPWHQPLLDGLL